MICKKHPRYRAILKPRVNCGPCWIMYNEKHHLKLKYRARTVKEFIESFLIDSEHDELASTFRYGFCYYFCVILKERFPTGTILYSIPENHFIFQYGKKLYDVLGNVTSQYNLLDLVVWDTWKEDLAHKKIIERDTIRKDVAYI